MVVYELKNEKAIVRIHEGKLTEAERNQVIRKATERYFRAILPQLQRLGLEDEYTIKPEPAEASA